MKITSSSCAKNCYAEWVVGTGNGGAQENTTTPDGRKQKHGKELPTTGAAAQSLHQLYFCSNKMEVRRKNDDH
jgi:hypothetical protein